MPGFFEMLKAEQFDSATWEIFSGAEQFKTGEKPLYRGLPGGFAIADASGIEVVTDDITDGTYEIYKWAQGETSNWTYRMAMLIINSLYFGESPDTSTIKLWLIDYGFELIGG